MSVVFNSESLELVSRIRINSLFLEIKNNFILYLRVTLTVICVFNTGYTLVMFICGHHGFFFI